MISNAPGSEHETVTDLYDRIGHTHLLASRSFTANAGSQHGSSRGIGCAFFEGGTGMGAGGGEKALVLHKLANLTTHTKYIVRGTCRIPSVSSLI